MCLKTICMNKNLPLMLMCITFILHSCKINDDFSDLKTEIETSLPFGYFQLTDDEIFSQTDDQMTVGADGILNFNNSQSIVFLDDHNAKEIVDVTFDDVSEDFNDLVAAASFTGGNIPDGVFFTDYNISLGGGGSLDRIVYESGRVTFKYDNDLRNVYCTVKEITKNGKSLVISAGETVDLSDGWVVAPENGKEMCFVYGGSFTPTAGDVMLNITFEAMVLKEVDGYFGNKYLSRVVQDVEIESSTTDFFDTIDELYLSDPVVEFDINNSCKIPVGAVIAEMQFYDGVNTKSVDIKSGFNTSAFYISEGESTIKITNRSTLSGSGLSDVFNKNIKSVKVTLDVILNPTDAQLSAETDIVPVNIKNSYNISMSAGGDMKLILPIKGYFSNLRYEENTDLSLDDLGDIDFKDIKFLLTGSNGIPVDINVDLYGVYPNGSSVKLTSESIKLKSSPVNVKPSDPAFREYVIDESNYQLINIEPKYINSLNDFENLRFEVLASTDGVDSKKIISIYSGVQSKININLGVKGTVNL